MYAKLATFILYVFYCYQCSLTRMYSKFKGSVSCSWYEPGFELVFIILGTYKYFECHTLASVSVLQGFITNMQLFYVTSI